MSVPVRPDGMITPAGGRSFRQRQDAHQLARDIEKALSKYVQDHSDSDRYWFRCPYSQQIRVIGQAAKPKLCSTENMTY